MFQPLYYCFRMISLSVTISYHYHWKTTLDRCRCSVRVQSVARWILYYWCPEKKKTFARLCRKIRLPEKPVLTFASGNSDSHGTPQYTGKSSNTCSIFWSNFQMVPSSKVIAMDNHPVLWEHLLFSMAMFNSYVSLPEGKTSWSLSKWWMYPQFCTQAVNWPVWRMMNRAGAQIEGCYPLTRHGGYGMDQPQYFLGPFTWIH